MSAIILAIPQQTEVLEIDCDQDWREAFEFSYFDTDGVTEIARTFTDCTIVGGLASNPKAPAVRVDLTSGGDTPNLTVAGNVVTVGVLRDDIKGVLVDGLYKFGLSFVDAGGRTLGLIEAKRQVTHGVLL